MTNSNGQGGSALTLNELKRAARARGLALMQQCKRRGGLGHRIASQVYAAIQPGAMVAAYHPMRDEPDFLTDLLSMWAGKGGRECVVALPRTPARGLPLTFHRFDDGDELVPERFGAMTSSGPEVQPDVLLVPLLAFDRRGHRLGYGGGYYDRTIAARPGIRTIGCAYAALEMPEVPIGPYDQPLGAVATETEFITIKGR